MSTLLLREARLGKASAPTHPRAAVWLLASLIMAPAMYLALLGQFAIVVAVMVLSALVLISLNNKNLAIAGALLFLLFLGDIRRVVAAYLGSPGMDPLLLVGTLFATFLAIPLLLRLRVADGFSKGVLGLTVFMSLEVLNPIQGPLSVGLSGALFYLTPLFWFWIARRYATEELFLILLRRIVIPAGVLAAILGICQTYVGFLPWESAWIKTSLAAGYTALNLGGGHIRSFGFSSNSAEYGNLLVIATACCVAAFLAGRRVYVLLVPLLLTALLLASQRGPLVKLMLAVAMMWAIQNYARRGFLPKLFVAVLMCAGMALGLSHIGGGEDVGKGSAADYATRHVTQGLAHPFDSRYSTAGIHADLFWQGIESGVRHPLGFGLGSVTIASGKFGGGDPAAAGSSEVDVSDAFISLGVLGGLLYVFVILAGLRYVFLYSRIGPEAMWLPIIGILICMLGSWIPLGEYAVGPLLWFCLGFVVRNLQGSLQPVHA